MKYYQPLGEQPDAPYIDANSAGGIEGSAVPAGAIEHPQREIVNAIKAAGIEPSEDNDDQLSKAIKSLIVKGSAYSQNQINNVITTAGLELDDNNFNLLSDAIKKIFSTDILLQSIYQESMVLNTPVITLQERKCRYIRNVIAGDAFSIDKSALKQTDKDITFELIINMPTVVAFSFAAITSVWMNDFVPDMSVAGQHWIAFLSQDGGLTWRASYEGRF